MQPNDARDLAILDMDRRRLTKATIAATVGLSRGTVGKVIADIRADDIAHDPEAADWWQRHHPTQPRKRRTPQ
jgi:DNA transposition AAA+ family ATPase